MNARHGLGGVAPLSCTLGWSGVGGANDPQPHGALVIRLGAVSGASTANPLGAGRRGPETAWRAQGGLPSRPPMMCMELRQSTQCPMLRRAHLSLALYSL